MASILFLHNYMITEYPDVGRVSAAKMSPLPIDIEQAIWTDIKWEWSYQYQYPLRHGG